MRRRIASRLCAGLCLAAPAIAMSGGPALATATPPAWTQSHTTLPPNGTQAGMAFDDATGQLVLSAGGQTWTWDGQAWTQLTTASPLQPQEPTLAYDATTKQLVSFGGLFPDGFTSNATSQTWTWNGAHWLQQHPATVPAPVEGACAGFDTASGQMIMVGGTTPSTQTTHNETWNWTGSNWVQLYPAASPLGGDCSMTYDPAVHKLVLTTFGSKQGSGQGVPQIWTWDGSSWAQVWTPLPEVSIPSSLAYDSNAGLLITYVTAPSVDTGVNRFTWGGFENETWSWDGSTWTMLSVTTAATRSFGGQIAFDNATHQMLLEQDDAQSFYGSTKSADVLLTQLSGMDRQSTAVAVSQSAFASTGSASAAVLARADGFADALAGGPLAAAKHAPLLLTSSTGLDDVTKTEIERVLKPGGTVYILGGTSALSPAIVSSIAALGDVPTRLAGTDRFATALAIAATMGNPSTVFEASGITFADALSAVPAAIVEQGVILLTNGSTASASTSAYLRAHPGLHYAVGVPASTADPSAITLAGADRYATSAAIAFAIFPDARAVSVASGTTFPDALAGGAVAGAAGEPVLLVPPSGSLDPADLGYLGTRAGLVTSETVFGGPSAVPESIIGEVSRAFAGP